MGCEPGQSTSAAVEGCPSAWPGLLRRQLLPDAENAERGYGPGGYLLAEYPAVVLSGLQRAEGAAGGGAKWSLGGRTADEWAQTHT